MKLSTYLTDKNITDAAFAEKAGVSQSQINRLKHGRTKPSWDLAVKIEKITGGKVKAKDLAVTSDQADAEASAA